MNLISHSEFFFAAGEGSFATFFVNNVIFVYYPMVFAG